ncbi:3,4-dihydroxy-2-butanone-4-phosphate synthase [Rhodococcus erythropolis]|uniref:3,4-dihydroxy-2-butanone-4-phosphate synthase n=1 Tax=Rhodococcus erythropolis TaxID=1833 RepID=UPI002949D463|nr:3,4-dihydroxy-2-butanone-4-phosphate synthase [Rhodococcus erythropolis]MDV6212702.1 3,4-dihydroxy-2-butanone-4-phosphate synthase [Rhodococcus erythropolis]
MIVDRVDARARLMSGVEHAVRDLAAGRSIVLLHTAGAAIVFAARTANPAQMAFAIRHSSGFVQVALAAAQCDRLMIPRAAEMYRHHSTTPGSQQCAGVDAANGIGTGISAADRARTARVLADPTTVMTDLTRPGHLIPVSVDPDVSHEMSAASTASFLTRLATDNPAAVFAEIILDVDPVDLPSRLDVLDFARAHTMCSVDSFEVGSSTVDRQGVSSVDDSYST